MRGLHGLAPAVCTALLCALTAACNAAVPPAQPDLKAPAPAPVELKVGDEAPPFSLAGSDGNVYSLANYKDKQVVVLAWFAKAFTGP
jgi:hypothetical protein